MTAQSDAYEAEVRSALIGLMRTRSGHRKVWDQEPLRGWSTDLLSVREDAPGDAWVLLQRKLSDPALDDPMLLAAGWLLKLRGDAAEDVQRDTRRPIAEVLPDANHRSRPAKTVAARNLVAVACLELDTDAAQVIFERDAERASVFQVGRGETRGQKLVAERLRQTAEDWFSREEQLVDNRPSMANAGPPADHSVRASPATEDKSQLPSLEAPSALRPAVKRFSPNWRWAVGGGALLVLLVVAALVIPSLSPATHQPLISGPSPSPNLPSPPGSPSLPPQVNHVSRVAPLPVSNGSCPTPHDARAEQRVKIEVFWWCIGSAITGSGEWDDTQFAQHDPSSHPI